MTKPTEEETRAAIDVLARAGLARNPRTAKEALAMTDAELDAAGIGPEELIRLAAKDGDILGGLRDE